MGMFHSGNKLIRKRQLLHIKSNCWIFKRTFSKSCHCE